MGVFTSGFFVGILFLELWNRIVVTRLLDKKLRNYTIPRNTRNLVPETKRELS